MSDTLDNQENQEINQDINEIPLLKAKKPRTVKQMEAFEKLRQKRTDNIANKKELMKIEASKILLAADIKIDKLKPKKEREPDTSSSEEEIVIRKSKSIKDKKKKKKIVIVQDSDSETESDEYDDIVEEKPKQRSFLTQQNKKSVIKINNQSIHDHVKIKIPYDPKKYFLD
jgi:hypothetical protein